MNEALQTELSRRAFLGQSAGGLGGGEGAVGYQHLLTVVHLALGREPGKVVN